MAEWPITDKSLLDNAASADESAQKALADQYKNAVENFLSCIGVDKSRIDDSVQLVFLRVFRALPKRQAGDLRDAKFSAFLKQICRRENIDDFRRAERRVKCEDLSEDQLAQIERGSADADTISLFLETIFEEKTGYLTRLLANDGFMLTELQRSIFVGALVDGLSFRELGRRHEMNHETAKSVFQSVAAQLLDDFRRTL